MSRGIYSVYLSEAEEKRVVELAKENGVSKNFVVRIAVRKLLGLSTVELALTKPTNSSN